MESFKGKRILFIGQVFYDYHTKIIESLEMQGATVVFFENKIHFQDPNVNKGLLGIIARKFSSYYKENYTTSKIIHKIANKKFDYLFVIGGFSITGSFIEQIKKKNKGIITILYLWDSLNVWKYDNILKFFDRKFSFDFSDVKKYKGLKYLPLFYTDEFKKKDIENTEADIDILYIGSVSPSTLNRLEIADQTGRLSEKRNLNSFIYLYVPYRKRGVFTKLAHITKYIFLGKYRNFWNAISNSKYVFREPLSRSQVSKLFTRAKVVLDVPVSGQVGQTIRTIETLASGKKLVTTNLNIKNEFFFNPSAVRIYSDYIKDIDSFAEGKDTVNIDYLYIDNWLKEIFYGT
ncbi:MAG: hypothetical protein QM640_06560 [Niabella sp.]